MSLRRNIFRQFVCVSHHYFEFNVTVLLSQLGIFYKLFANNFNYDNNILINITISSVKKNYNRKTIILMIKLLYIIK